MNDTTPIWRPSAEGIARANLTRFASEVRGAGAPVPDAHALYDWSINSPQQFWPAVWKFCGIVGDGPGPMSALPLEQALKSWDAEWFPEARLNFAQNLLRFRDDKDAIVSWDENGRRRRLSFAELHDEVHIGNFVEVKKTTIGAGSKANHLTYLGDAIVGEKVNVGAGTVTCNYDGANKSTTVIGDGAFIGSGTMLVAPVQVGANATIGAGSTVSREVPADKLTVARSRQVTVEGWKRPVKKSKPES